MRDIHSGWLKRIFMLQLAERVLNAVLMTSFKNGRHWWHWASLQHGIFVLQRPRLKDTLYQNAYDCDVSLIQSFILQSRTAKTALWGLRWAAEKSGFDIFWGLLQSIQPTLGPILPLTQCVHGDFSVEKRKGARCWPLTSTQCRS